LLSAGFCFKIRSPVGTRRYPQDQCSQSENAYYHHAQEGHPTAGAISDGRPYRDSYQSSFGLVTRISSVLDFLTKCRLPGTKATAPHAD
jgi:hypothetical protein